MDGLLGARLLKGNEEVPTSSIAGAGVIGIYFSAHWCGPCKEYTPQLRKVYERAKEKGKSFEIVFVSSDRDEASFKSYFSTMPWHAVPFSDRMRQQSLSAVFQVKGIPGLVLVNGSGGLIDANGRAKVMLPGYLSTLPRVCDIRDVGPLPQDSVQLTVRHRGNEYEIECEPNEGWEMLKMQIFSLTEVPEEQQRLFGLGVALGPLDESVPLPRALAGGLFAQRGSGLRLAGVPQERRAASSAYNHDGCPDEKPGDPHHSGCLDSAHGWVCKNRSVQNEWYQLDLGSSQDIAGVAVAPRTDMSQYIERLKLSTAESEEGPWAPADGGREFEACRVFPQAPVRILLEKAVRARFVRIIPTAFHKRPALRADVILADGGGADEQPSIVVLGNASKDDPFEFRPSSQPAANQMVEQQHLAMLQVKLMSLPPRLQNEVNSLQGAKGYEDRALQRQAQDDVPVVAMDRLVREGKSADGYEVAFMKKVLLWYKKHFFEWTNAPACDHCGSTDTKTVGRTEPNQFERQFRAGTVEVARCNTCGGETRFPRYNDPSKLLEWRQGRCGEWANCFTLICRALGYEARHCHDWTDHVWTEIYSDTLQRWLHADSCEQALDSPLMYEQGWGKKLTYVLAYAHDHAVDVTKRYTRKFDEVLTRRNQFGEQDLKRAMSAISEFATDRAATELREEVASKRRQVLEQRATREAEEFERGGSAPAKPEEQIGRTSGDAQWREQRGELGADKDAKAKALALSGQGVACASTPPAQAGELDLEYLTLSVNSERCHGSEAFGNVKAGDDQKWCADLSWFPQSTAQFEFNFSAPVVVTELLLMSANDFPERDPSHFILLDGDGRMIQEWRGIGSIPGRWREVAHRVTSPTGPHTKWSLQFLGTQSGDIIQLGRIRFRGTFAKQASGEVVAAASAVASAAAAALQPCATAPAASAEADAKAKQASAMKAHLEAKIKELLTAEPGLSRTEATVRVIQGLKANVKK